MPSKRKSSSKSNAKIMDILPADMRKAFKKPHLQNLTLSDLNDVSWALMKFAKRDPKKFIKSSCAACLCTG